VKEREGEEARKKLGMNLPKKLAYAHALNQNIVQFTTESG